MWPRYLLNLNIFPLVFHLSVEAHIGKERVEEGSSALCSV